MLDRHPFREILANETIRVLVRTALPPVIGRGEVDGHTGRLLNVSISVELSAVVGGDRLE